MTLCMPEILWRFPALSLKTLSKKTPSSFSGQDLMTTTKAKDAGATSAASLSDAGFSDTPPDHVPVLFQTMLEKLAPLEGVFCDATFGRGGYTKGLLAEKKVKKVIALDRDPDAIAFGEKHFDNEIQKGRLQLIHTRFSDLQDHIPPDSLDGIVFDFGLSSPQIDEGQRGFSFMKDGPLDMGMGLNQGRSVASFLKEASADEMADVLFSFGGEKKARLLARVITERRTEKPFQTTRDLAALCEDLLPRLYKKSAGPHHTSLHPATKTFQALRIWANEELDEIKEVLPQAAEALKPGGRFVAVAFHELEDRLVKRFLKPLVKNAHRFRSILYGPAEAEDTPVFKCPKGQPIQATPEEIRQNPRARSAKLRFAIKTGAAQ